VDCPKLFPRVVPPPPQTSSTPTNNRRRSPLKPLTKRGLLEERKAMRNKIRNMQKRTSAGGIRIRGRWISPGKTFTGASFNNLILSLTRDKAPIWRPRSRTCLRWLPRCRQWRHPKHTANWIWDLPTIPRSKFLRHWRSYITCLQQHCQSRLGLDSQTCGYR